MKSCPTCKKSYPDDANFCPEESCATPDGPQRLVDAGAAAPSGGRFQPIAKLGGGTTGEVWRARDAQTGTDVAYKVIAADVLANAGAVARAEREYKQLQRVASPRLVAIVDCDKTPDGRLWVAMELCDGAESLDRVLRKGPVGLDRAKAIVGQIGQALLEAQKAGLVHRDLAPKNVLVLPSGDVKLTNFPVAKPISDRVAGTAAYLSPEQAQGKTADQRSNTYSLACILYHLLTGEPPFAAATPQALLDLHVSSPPLAPSQRRPDAALSPDLDKLVLKALDKSSSRRHLTLRLFLTEVEALAPGAPAVAPGAGAPATSARDVGFAKTMLFAGGQADVQKMVANAIAARAAAGKAPTPSPAAPAAGLAAAPTVQAQPQPAVAPPVAAAPVAAAPVAAAPSRLTPPPVTPANGSPATEAASPGAAKGGAAFRETLWFKKGDVEQMVAEAKAKMGMGAPTPVPPEIAPEDAALVEDRYKDDGSVTAEDRKKFSLRTGGTATAMPSVASAIPGEKMSDEELAGELAGSGRRKTVMVAAVAIVAVVLLGVFFLMRSPEPAAPAPKPAAAAPAPPPPAPAPAPAAAAPEPAKPAEAAKPAEPVKPVEAKPAEPAAAKKRAHGARDKKDKKRH